MTSTGWPDLTWSVPPQSQNVTWLLERIRTMAHHARAFELALDQASESGAAPLAPAVPSIEKWDKVVANVWDYAGRDAASLSSDEFDYHAEELSKLWKALGKYRARILEAVGERGSSSVRGWETRVEVTKDSLVDRVSTWAVASDEMSPLGVVTSSPILERSRGRPVTADELQARSSAESKALPSPPTLENLLAAQPAPWVHAISAALSLEPLEPSEESSGKDSRVAAQRLQIQRRLLDPAFLRGVIGALEEQERALLQALLEAPEGLRYQEVTREYGADEADGFYWGERPPSGPLARLRRAGLAYVGGGLSGTVVLTPPELAEILR